jgi:hypothetical protein
LVARKLYPASTLRSIPQPKARADAGRNLLPLKESLADTEGADSLIVKGENYVGIGLEQAEDADDVSGGMAEPVVGAIEKDDKLAGHS